MQNQHLPFRVERLSASDTQLLRRRMFAVWVIGLLIGALAGYFLFGFGGFKDMRIPLIVFSVFFYGILGLILFVHTRNAFRTEKKIYEGPITDKRTESTRNSSASEQYFIALNGAWFRVDLKHFQQVHVGEAVELLVLGKGHVFKIEKFQTAQEVFIETPEIHRQTELYTAFSGLSEQFTESEKYILKSHIRKALFYRTIIGFLAAWLLSVLLDTLAVIFTLEANSGMTLYLYIHYAILILLVAGFMLVNRKTWLLILDLRSGKKEIIVEKIIDRVQSEHIKPSPNAMIVRKNTTHYRYYYIQTEHFWLNANEETYASASAGKNLIIQRGVHSHVILNFGF